MSEIEFKPRWKEELEAVSAEGKLVFEFTMGEQHVYFPDEARWRAIAPAWAKEKWALYETACRAWCGKNRIPISLVPDAHLQAERNNVS